MTVQIVVRQVRSTVPAGFRVYSEILDGIGQTTGIGPELFVYRYVNGTEDTYQHVATVADVKTVTRQGDTGWDTVGEFYRRKTATLDYTNVTAAIDQAALMKSRLEDLAINYNAAVIEYESSTGAVDYESADGNRKLTLDTVSAQVGAEDYQVTSNVSVTGLVGIPRELFLFKLLDPLGPDIGNDEYVRVVTVDDIRTYPTNVSWVSGDYYRYYEADEHFPYLATANTHNSTIDTDLTALVEVYDESTDEFEGEETTIYTS